MESREVCVQVTLLSAAASDEVRSIPYTAETCLLMLLQLLEI